MVRLRNTFNTIRSVFVKNVLKPKMSSPNNNFLVETYVIYLKLFFPQNFYLAKFSNLMLNGERDRAKFLRTIDRYSTYRMYSLATRVRRVFVFVIFFPLIINK